MLGQPLPSYARKTYIWELLSAIRISIRPTARGLDQRHQQKCRSALEIRGQGSRLGWAELSCTLRFVKHKSPSLYRLRITEAPAHFYGMQFGE